MYIFLQVIDGTTLPQMALSSIILQIEFSVLLTACRRPWIEEWQIKGTNSNHIFMMFAISMSSHRRNRPKEISNVLEMLLCIIFFPAGICYSVFDGRTEKLC